MGSEAARTALAEDDWTQLPWEQRLESEIYRTLDEPGPPPKIHLAEAAKNIPASASVVSRSVGGRDYTRNRIASDGTEIRIRIYVPEPGLQASRPYREDDAALKYDIKMNRPGKHAFAVSPSGATDMPSPGSSQFYEGYQEANGTPGIYRFDDNQLHPVDPTEGERLLWQLAQSVPSSPIIDS
jgi:hypothetical protein